MLEVSFHRYVIRLTHGCQLLSEENKNRVRPRLRLELEKYPRHVVFQRAVRDAQHHGNLFVAHAGGDLAQDFALAWAEWRARFHPWR